MISSESSQRFIDYFAIVGVKHPNGNLKEKPMLLRRYPEIDYNDYLLPDDICYFCQPEGCITVFKRPSPQHEDASSFIFTLTDKKSGRMRYGICLNFYRLFEKLHEHKDNNKLIRCTDNDKSRAISKNTSMKLQEYSVPVPVAISNSDDSPLERKSQCISSLKASPDEAYPQYFYTLTLTSLCLVSSHPFLSTFKSCLLTMKQMIEAINDKAMVANQENVGDLEMGKLYNFWDILTGNVFNTRDGDIVHEVRKLESWISRLMSCPISSPGMNRITLKLLPPSMKASFTLAVPDRTRFTLLDYQLHRSLKLLGVDLYLQVFVAVLLEQKVVVESSDYDFLATFILGLTNLLYPLQYMFPVIALLPPCMPGSGHLLRAPTPYIIGLPRSFHNLQQNFKFPGDVWRVDLDLRKLTKPLNGDFLPNLPEPETSILKNKLRQALASLGTAPCPSFNDFPNDQNDGAFSLTKIFRTKGRTMNFHDYENNLDIVDVTIRVAMVKFLCSPSLLGQYSDHMRTLRLFPRPVVVFQQHNFLQSRSKQSVFTKLLSKTLAVEYLGEWSLSPSNIAFLKIRNGVSDPLLIGDKARWYAEELPNFVYSMYDDNSDFPNLSLETDKLTSQRPLEKSFNNNNDTCKEVGNTGSLVERSDSVRSQSQISNHAFLNTASSPSIPMLSFDSSHFSQLSTRENLEFLKATTQDVARGKGVSWLDMMKIRRLMEEENLRIFLLQRLNQSTQEEGNCSYAEKNEIALTVYKVMLDLLKCVLTGIEFTYRSSCSRSRIASVFMMLEISHTHYYVKELKEEGSRTSIRDDNQERHKEDLITQSTASIEKDNPRTASSASRKSQYFNNNDSVNIMNAASRILEGSHSITVPAMLGKNPKGDQYYRDGKFISVDADAGSNERKTFLFEGLLEKERSKIWDKTRFWEDVFLDAVAMEREEVGIAQESATVIEKYHHLSSDEKKSFEGREDKVLSTVLYNLIIHMFMMKVNLKDIKKQVRRLLGKSHVGLSYTAEVNLLLQHLGSLQGVAVDLKQCGSYHIRLHSFPVHAGADPSSNKLHMEVCRDVIILRNLLGAINARWRYDAVMHVTFYSKTRVVYIWRRTEQRVCLHKFYSEKYRQICYCIKNAMDKISTRTNVRSFGEYPVEDLKTGQRGLLQVTLNGINLKFTKSKAFVGNTTVHKCKVDNRVLIVQMYHYNSDGVTTQKFKSTLADEVKCSLLCLKSYITTDGRTRKPLMGQE